ncbi:MAG: glycosyltransferase family 2 protein [Deltaproteobacteria bacterium]|jgi:glycosyltransferase involved in cell wall biosynthesis|nr:glycosyltransferase family 2 protein [Deltaproteobacteria bacterium]
MTAKLSVSLITYNAQRLLKNVLSAVAPIADEIVIVDNGSTDDTLEIAKEFGVKVFIEDWKGYGKQKQSCIAKCSGDWILALDADEVLTPNSLEVIKRVINSAQYSAYEIVRINYCFEKLVRHCFPDEYKIRLFKAGTANFSSALVHEKVEVADAAGVGRLREVQILHYTGVDLEDFVFKTHKYAITVARQHYISGKRSNIFSIIFKPIFKFCKMYFFQLGFLDGVAGLILSFNAANYKFISYAQLYLLVSGSRARRAAGEPQE